MSYSQTIKERLCAEKPNKLCCRKALINGILVASATADTEGLITVKLSGKTVIDRFRQLIEEAYRQTPTVTPLAGGGHSALVSFCSKSAMRYLAEVEEAPDYPFGEDFVCQGCRAAFFSGVFLGCGQISDPQSGYRMDFAPVARVAQLAVLFAGNGVPALLTKRKGQDILYYRSVEGISDWFGIIKLVDVYFDMQNTFFTRELNNVTNRQNNCTIRNIQRSVQSVSKQVDLIRQLQDKQLMSLLPDELRETAELRLKYYDYSLSQLALASNPPLTKSGLNHRLRKIMEFAEEALTKKDT